MGHSGVSQWVSGAQWCLSHCLSACIGVAERAWAVGCSIPLPHPGTAVGALMAALGSADTGACLR